MKYIVYSSTVIINFKTHLIKIKIYFFDPFSKAMKKCIFCLEEKNLQELTDEHIIYEAMGGSAVLEKAACRKCQEQCNKSFEGRLLKGASFIALLRANLGLRGKRNEPVFGLDKHGKPITIIVQQGFPPIRVGIGKQKLERPMQIILAKEYRKPLTYHFLPNEISCPILPSFFDSIVTDIPSEAIFAGLWADGNIIPVNHWYELLGAFVTWANLKKLTPIVSCIAAGHAEIPLELNLNTPEEKRAITKIGFMYALSKMENHYHMALESLRQYILNENIPDKNF